MAYDKLIQGRTTQLTNIGTSPKHIQVNVDYSSVVFAGVDDTDRNSCRNYGLFINPIILKTQTYYKTRAINDFGSVVYGLYTSQNWRSVRTSLDSLISTTSIAYSSKRFQCQPLAFTVNDLFHERYGEGRFDCVLIDKFHALISSKILSLQSIGLLYYLLLSSDKHGNFTGSKLGIMKALHVGYYSLNHNIEALILNGFLVDHTQGCRRLALHVNNKSDFILDYNAGYIQSAPIDNYDVVVHELELLFPNINVLNYNRSKIRKAVVKFIDDGYAINGLMTYLKRVPNIYNVNILLKHIAIYSKASQTRKSTATQERDIEIVNDTNFPILPDDRTRLVVEEALLEFMPNLNYELLVTTMKTTLFIRSPRLSQEWLIDRYLTVQSNHPTSIPQEIIAIMFSLDIPYVIDKTASEYRLVDYLALVISHHNLPVS